MVKSVTSLMCFAIDTIKSEIHSVYWLESLVSVASFRAIWDPEGLTGAKIKVRQIWPPFWAAILNVPAGTPFHCTFNFFVPIHFAEKTCAALDNVLKKDRGLFSGATRLKCLPRKKLSHLHRGQANNILKKIWFKISKEVFYLNFLSSQRHLG